MRINEIKYVSKTHKILTESVWQQLDESTQQYLNRWEKELWPLLEEYQTLTEQDLTPDQVQQLFKDAESLASGQKDYQTYLGQQGQEIAQAGQAVIGAVKIPFKIVSAINNKINELGKIIQDTTPVQNIDAAFEKTKKDLYDKLGGKDSKVVQAIEKMSALAKDHPGKSKFLVALLTTAAAFATGPGGGAAAGFALRAGLDVLAGEQLSTAVGKSVKFAAYGWLAGEVFNLVSEPFKDWLLGANVEELKDTAKAITRRELYQAQDLIDAQVANIDSQLASQWDHTISMTDSKTIGWAGGYTDVAANPALNTTKLYFTSSDQISAYANLQARYLDAMDHASQYNMVNDTPEWQSWLKVFAEHEQFVQTVEQTTNQSQLGWHWTHVNDLSNQLAQVQSQEAIDIIKPQIEELQRNLVGDITKDKTYLEQFQKLVASAVQGEVTATGVDKDLEKRRESIEMKYLAGLPLTEAEENFLKKAMKSAGNAAKTVGSVVAKAGGAVAKGTKAVSKELGNTITVRKLNQIWKERGSSTSLDMLYSVLEYAGLNQEDIKKLMSKYQPQQPEQPAQPAQSQAKRPQDRTKYKEPGVKDYVPKGDTLGEPEHAGSSPEAQARRKARLQKRYR